MLQGHFTVEYMSLGRNIKRLRIGLGYTQNDLARISGIKMGHISKLERSESDPKLSTIYKLMTALECSADNLLLNPDKTGLSGVLKASYDSAANLPDEQKETVINVIDAFCMAYGLKDIVNKSPILINSRKSKIKGIMEEDLE